MPIRVKNILFLCLVALSATLLPAALLSACTVGLPAPATGTATAATAKPARSTSAPPPTLAASAPPSATPTATQPSLPAESVRGQIIRFWHPWRGAEGQAIEKLVEMFNLNNEWGVTVVAEALDGLDGIQAHMAAAPESGQAPDVVVGFLHQALNWRAANGAGDGKGIALANWQPYLDDPTWGISATQRADFYPAVWEAEVVDGQRLGIPALRSAQVLYYNRTWAAEMEFFTPPLNPQQFANQACASAEALRKDETDENDLYGGWIASANYAASLSWIYSYGGKIIEDESTGAENPYRFSTPQTAESFAFQRDLYDGQCAWFDEAAGVEMAFAQRKGILASGSVMGIPYQAELMRQAGRGDEWTVIPYPAPAGASPVMVIYGPSYYLLRSSPERELASWLFVRWLSQPKQHVQMVEASGSFPIRQGELTGLEAYRQRYPAYVAALALLPGARPEPALASWEQVRWALNDATTQLFRPYFKVDQIPTMLEYLDKTVTALLQGPERSGVWDTPTPTPVPSATPTRTPWPSANPTP